MKNTVNLLVLLFLSTSLMSQSVVFQRSSELMPEDYTITGTAFLEELSNGDLQFRLSSDFSTPFGPDVRIILNNSVSGTGGEEVVNLSDISHFSGPLTVDLDSSVDIEDYDFVVFYCVTFSQLWASGEFGPTIDLSSPSCDPSDVNNAGGSNFVDICPTDGSSDLIVFSNSLGLPAGTEYAYLITDENEILEQVITSSSSFNFEGSGPDEQRVYGINYSGTLSAAIGSNRLSTTASDCFEHSSASNFITITKDACITCDPSDVNNATGPDVVDICPTDGNNDWLAFSNSLGLPAGSEYAYLITDADENLEEIIFDNIYNFEGSSNDEQRVYGMNYSGTLSIAIGSNRSLTTASDCFQHSSANEFITVTKNSCIPPFVCMDSETTTTLGASIDICPTDGTQDSITFENTLNLSAGPNYAYLITDNNEILQQLILTDTYNFEGTSLDTQRVYGMHYDGSLSIALGFPRTQTTASGCFDHSSSTDFVSVTKNACIPPFVCMVSSTSSNFGNVVDICPTDGLQDTISFTNTLNLDAGTNYAYLITDENEVVQDVSFVNDINFEGTGLATQRVYGVHYDGTLNVVTGQNRMMTTATECFTHSEASTFVMLTKNACPPAFNCLSSTISSGGSNGATLCAMDGAADIVDLNNSINASAGDHYAYLITDTNNTLLDFTITDQYDFENASESFLRVHGIHYDGTLVPVIGQNRLMTTASGCFEHSTNLGFLSISTIDCVIPVECLASTVSMADGSNSTDICAEDGDDNIITFSNNLASDVDGEYAYLITDANQILQSVVTGTSFNFEGSSTAEQRVYGIHFDGTLSPQIGMNRTATTASECHEHSSATDFISITKNACIIPFECLQSFTFTDNNALSIDLCTTDGADDIISLQNNLGVAAGVNYAYLVTDENNILQWVSLEDEANFEGTGEATSRVFGVHYDGTLSPRIGEDRLMTTASGCFEHSAAQTFLTVTKEACIAPFECMESLTATTDWAIVADICPNDGLEDIVELRNNLFIPPGENYAYLITDATGILQEVSLDSLFDFEGSSLEEQRVYGIHFDGTLNPVIGADRLMTTATGCFTHSGDNLFLTISKTGCISDFECVESLTATTFWVTEVDICAGDGEDDWVLLQNNIDTPPGENYAFLLTDENEVLQEVILDSLYNFEDSGIEEQRVYGVSYAGELFPQIGEDRKSTTASDCFIHSGDNLFITLNKTAACVSSTSDPSLAEAISVFPNPSNGQITIDLRQSTVDFEQLFIYGLDGKIIQTVDTSNSIDNVFIDNPGIYLIRFENEEVSTVKRIIVQ